MKVLVTGATGYIGRRLVDALIDTDHNVRVVVRESSSRFESAEQFIGNLADSDSLTDVAKGIEVIYHLGGGMRPSDGDFQTVNIEGTKRLMHEAIRSDVQRFVFVSTATVYGNVANPPAKESDTCNPLTGHAYAISKLKAEEELLKLSGFGTKITILRPAQVYSSRSPAVQRFPTLASMVDGNTQTHFVHREDVVRAAMFLARRADSQGIFNVADEQPLTIREVANILRDAGFGVGEHSPQGSGTIPPMLRRIMEATLVLDITKVSELGFSLKYPSLYSGILHES